MADIVESMATSSAYLDASGSIRNSRSIPNAPNCVNIPESRMEPWVDASACASGSQKCIGKMGMLAMNAMNMTRNINVCVAGAILPALLMMYCMSNERSGVWK